MAGEMTELTALSVAASVSESGDDGVWSTLDSWDDDAADEGEELSMLLWLFSSLERRESCSEDWLSLLLLLLIAQEERSKERGRSAGRGEGWG